ncbi:HDOD domain-containing protein [Shewanella maritima]|uniref:HDOD domain-containing protein n=1 Tax=Shewanella maritima TaxID=2520507 RepID=UPI0037353DA9
MAVSIAGGVKPGKIIQIERRLYRQMIVGKRNKDTITDKVFIEAADDANKLEIERIAINERLKKQADAQATYRQISMQLTNTVNNAIEHELASPELVLANSNVTESQMLVLEMVLEKDPNLARLRPLVSGLSWLARDLTTLINSPASSHRRPKSADVQVTDLKLVLNYIGVENLRLLIPYFSLRYCLPSNNANLAWPTRKLWRYSIMTAIAAKALAEMHRLPTGLVYTGALMNQFGSAVILNNSASIFSKTWGNWLREASEEGNREVHDAVMATEFPIESVLEHVLEQGQQLNWRLLTLLNFEESRLTKVLKELDEHFNLSDLSAEAAVIAKASCYAKMRLLEEQNLIDNKEKRLMADYYQFLPEELIRLKAQNYRKVDLI